MIWTHDVSRNKILGSDVTSYLDPLVHIFLLFLTLKVNYIHENEWLTRETKTGCTSGYSLSNGTSINFPVEL
jgi:hypothetical protein